MSKNNNLTDFLRDVANTIREKKGVSGNIDPQDFSSEIKSIKSDPELETLSRRYTANKTETIEPSVGKDGFSSVTIEVDVPTSGGTDYKIQSKNVTVTENNKQTEIKPDSDYHYMDVVNVTTAIPMQEKSVTYDDNVSGDEIEADSGYGGLSKVTVNVDVPIQVSKWQDITTAGGTTITPTSGYKAMKEVVVTPVLESKSDTIKNNGTYSFTPSLDKCGLSKVTVNVDVPTSGGGESVVVKEPVPKDVNFYDYDGTLLYSYTKDEVQENLTALPAPPSAPVGLGLEGTVEWNYTLDQIKKVGVYEVGSIYTKNSGLVLVFDIPYDNFTLGLRLRCSSGEANVDWGDYQSYLVGGQEIIGHTYTKAGRYVIRYDAKDSSATITVGTSNYNVCNDMATSSTNGFAHSSLLVGAVLGKNCKLNDYAFCYCGLSYCIISKGISSVIIPKNAFNCCYQLKHITFPCAMQLQTGALSNSGVHHLSLTEDGGDVIADSDTFSVLNNCPNLRRLVLPPAKDANTLPLSNLSSTTSLCQIVVKKGRTFINRLTLTSLAVLDLTDYDDVPTLEGSLTLPTNCKIFVKLGLQSEFQSATNWSLHSSKFVGV